MTQRIIDTGLTENDFAKMLDEVAALIEEPQPDPDEFTASQYAAHQGITYDAASGALERAYRAGKLTRRKLGKNWFYRKA